MRKSWLDKINRKLGAQRRKAKARLAQDRADKVARLLDVHSCAELPSFDVIYAETRDAWLRLFSTVDALDSKATTILALDGILIGGLFAIVAEGSLFKTTEPGCLLNSAVGVIWGGLVLVAGSLILGLFSLRVRVWTELLDPEVVCAKRIKDQEEETRIQLLSNWISSYKKNKVLSKQKAWLLQCSIRLLGGAILVFTIFVALYVWVLAYRQ